MKIGVSSFPEPPECVWSGARESKSLGKHLAEDSTCDVTCKGAHSLLKNGIFSLICSFSESKHLLTSFDILHEPVTKAVFIYPGLFLTLMGFVVSCSAIFIDSLELFIDNESYSFDNEDIH